MRPLLKMFGGKGRLTKFIIGHFPKDYQNMHYYEPFIGGGSILLSKEVSISETVSDIDKDIIEAFKFVIGGDFGCIRKIHYTEENFNRACKNSFSCGISKIIQHRFSRSGRGDAFSYSERLRGNQSESINAWETFLNSLDGYKNRLDKVKLLNLSYLDVLEDCKDRLYYMDPPYLPSVRTSKKVYKYDWTEKDHIEFLGHISKIYHSKIIISGYDSVLYNNQLRNWNKYSKLTKNNSGEGKKKNDRTEYIWTNY